MSTATRTASNRVSAPVRPRAGADPGVEIPLGDWGSLALRAGRFGPVLPHMAWLLRFGDEVTEQTVGEGARRARAPRYGRGRGTVPPRFPGGRHRWRQEPTPPAVSMRSRPLAGADALS